MKNIIVLLFLSSISFGQTLISTDPIAPWQVGGKNIQDIKDKNTESQMFLAIFPDQTNLFCLIRCVETNAGKQTTNTFTVGDPSKDGLRSLFMLSKINALLNIVYSLTNK